jgi:hypothetical protein
VFDKLDVGKVVEVSSVPNIQMFRLTVDGVNRGETARFFGMQWPGAQPSTVQSAGGTDSQALCIASAPLSSPLTFHLLFTPHLPCFSPGCWPLGRRSGVRP